MSQRTLSVAAALVLTFALAACGEESEGPVTTPPPTIGAGSSDGSGGEPSDGGGEGEASDGGGESEGTTDAASSVPAPDPADYPGMDEETPEGAEQAFSYFWDVAIAGFQGGDYAQLEVLGAERCENCDELIKQMQDLDERNEHWSPLVTTEVDLVSKPDDGDFDYIVTYTFIIPAHTEPSDKGAEPSEWDEITYESTGGLVWESGAWKVVDFSADYSEGVEG